MKKNTIIGIVVVIIIVLVGIIALKRGTPSPEAQLQTLATELPATISETTKVSSTLTKYENDELGFTVTYPNTWALSDSPSGPSFIIPAKAAGETSGSPFASIEASIGFAGGACSAKGTPLKVGSLSFMTTSTTETIKAQSHMKHVYALAQDGVCYLFTLESATASSIAGAHAPIITSADQAFTDMVKSFAPVVSAAGDSETAHPAGK
jgi:hypothetical protein